MKFIIMIIFIISLIPLRLLAEKENRQIDKDLFQAVYNNDLNKVKKLINNGADIHAKMMGDELFWKYLLGEGATTLHIAAAQGHINMLDFIIEKGVDINVKSDDGDTPLFSALARKQNLNMLKHLIKKKANINARNIEGMTVLHIEADHGYFDKVKLLLNLGSNIEAKDQYAYTPIYYSVSDDDNYEITELLIKKGANINVLSNYGSHKNYSPLHHAVDFECLESVKLLVENGADINQSYFDYEKKKSFTALDIATNNNSKEIISFLKEKGAKGKKLTLEEQLIISIVHNELDNVNLLIQKGANVNYKLSKSRNIERSSFSYEYFSKFTSILHIASCFGNFNIVYQLIENGAIIDSVDIFGESPLHRACLEGHLNIVYLLITKGADVNKLDYTTGELVYDLNKGTLEIEYININKTNPEKLEEYVSSSPLNNACTMNHYSIAKLLIEKGAKVNTKV